MIPEICVIHFTLRKQGRRTPQHINCNHNPFLLREHRKNSEISFSLVIPFSTGEGLVVCLVRHEYPVDDFAVKQLPCIIPLDKPAEKEGQKCIMQ